jgi:uncharacterized protein (TIGR03000 family)
MYSVVLMVAMTTSVETPNCGRTYSCHGYYYGSCQGYYYGGCHGYSRGCHGYYYTGCCGCNGYYGTVIVPGHVMYTTAGNQNVIIASADGRAPQAAPAQIRVRLPENARLFVDSVPTNSTSSVRNLATPPLEGGKDFTYTLTASIMRDQKEMKLEKQVTVRAGETTEVSIEFPIELAQK